MKNKYFFLIATLIFCFATSSFSALASAPDVTMTPTQSSGTLYVGQSWYSTIYIHNNNIACSIQCTILETGLKSSTITTSPRDGTMSVGFQVDSNVAGPQYDNLRVQCYDYPVSFGCGSTYTPVSLSATTYYGYCGDGTKNGPEECDGSSVTGSCTAYGFDEGTLKCTSGCKIDTSSCTKGRSISQTYGTNAQTAISQANTAINTAKSRITTATNTGITDVSSATQYINLAQADYNSASTSLTAGTSAFNLKEYTTANSNYQQATTKAESAKNYAATAQSTVDKLIADYTAKQLQASNVVSDANSKIDTAKQRVESAEKILSDATAIGLVDIAQSKADIATARSKIDTALDYYKEASNMISAKNFNSAESKAQSAITEANTADTLATQAYNRLNERITVAGASAKSILSANTKVSQMNEIMLKIDNIVRSTEKLGVDLTSSQTVIAQAKTSVDSAEDSLSQAKNKQASGVFTEATTLADTANSQADTAQNRLDTITQVFTVSTQDALDKAYADAKNRLAQAEQDVQTAQATYGATPELIIAAQNDLSAAKNLLSQTETQIADVKSASDFKTMVQKAEIAFQSIDNTNGKTKGAKDNASGAKQGLTQKVAIGGAIVAGVAGGGFLIYRVRKKKNGQEKKESTATDKRTDEKKESKDDKKETPKKPLTNCQKCDAKLAKDQKFCAKCGAKVE